MGLASLASSFDKGWTLAVLKRNSIWLINTDPTATFTNFTASIGPEKVGGGVGCVGRRAWTVDGNDLIYVAPDKTVRSLVRMASAQGQYEISAAMSLPIQPWMDRVNWDYAHTIAAVKYREMILISVPLDNATSPDTVLAWNGRLRKWVGIWTGSVRRYLGAELQGAHDARADIAATVLVLGAQLATRHAAGLADAEEASKAPPGSYDRAGKLAVDEGVEPAQATAAQVRFTFGKHKGATVAAEPSYARWMLTSDFPEETKARLRALLATLPADAGARGPRAYRR
jgi:uncharacterized protein (DUF3820 family)